MTRERLTWLARAIAATDECEDSDFTSLYQEILDTVRADDGNELAEQVAPMIVMAMFKEAVKRGHLHLEIGLELMPRGVTVWEKDPQDHDVRISANERDAQLDFDIWDGQCIPGHIRHNEEWVVARTEKVEGEDRSYFPWPVNYWLLPETLPPQPMVRVTSLYMRTAHQISDDKADLAAWRKEKQEREDAKDG